jgi:ectoine hydroxylase-related dioxygenase (phytanoyl-CoA dioxygenase family)
MRSDFSRSLAEHGFAIVPEVFQHEEIIGVFERFSRTRPVRIRAGIRHALKSPEIARLAQDPRLVKLASEGLGCNAFPYAATLFDKSPIANWLVVWHQDTALPLQAKCTIPGWGPWSTKDGVLYAHAPARILARSIALRVHFDDSTEHNGPLRVLPGTHRLGVLTDDQIEELVHRNSAIECTVTCGGVVAMRPLIVHSSSKLQVKASRRVLHIEYAANRNLDRGIELAVP